MLQLKRWMKSGVRQNMGESKKLRLSQKTLLLLKSMEAGRVKNALPGCGRVPAEITSGECQAFAAMLFLPCLGPERELELANRALCRTYRKK